MKKLILLVTLVFSMSLGVVFADYKEGDELELKYITDQSYTNQYPIFRIDNYSTRPIPIKYKVKGIVYEYTGVVNPNAGYYNNPYYLNFPEYPADGKNTMTVILEYQDSKGNKKVQELSSLPIPVYKGIYGGQH